jgi:hypothetical protein
MIRARPREEQGLRYWTVGRDPRKAQRSRTSLHLLPIYDEFLVAYRDLRAVPRPAYLMGNFQHALVIGEQVAGTWRITAGNGRVAVNVEPLRRLTSPERRDLALEIARYQRFLGVPVSIAAD